MHRPACALAVAAVAAVAGAAPKLQAPPPPPIAGEWLWGTGGEPRRGPIAAVTTCGSYPAVVQIVEHDGVVDSDWQEARPMSGGAARPMPEWGESVSEKLHGTFDGTRLVLDGTHDVVHARGRYHPVDARDPPPDRHEPVHVELRFDKRSGHFVGTRNGVPLWLARGTIRPSMARSCPP